MAWLFPYSNHQLEKCRAALTRNTIRGAVDGILVAAVEQIVHSRHQVETWSDMKCGRRIHQHIAPQNAALVGDTARDILSGRRREPTPPYRNSKAQLVDGMRGIAQPPGGL